MFRRPGPGGTAAAKGSFGRWASWGVPLCFLTAAMIVMVGCAGRVESASRPTTRAAVDEPASRPAVLSRQERVLGLVWFYAAAKQHFAYFDRLGDLDWDRTFMDYLPLVEAEQSTLEYYRVLQRFAATLQDGHTEVYPPKAIQAELDRLPLNLGFVEGQWVVLERYPTQEILDKDIPPGTVVLAIDGLETSEFFERNVFPFVAAGSLEAKRSRAQWFPGFPKGRSVPLTLRHPDGTQEQRDLPANRRSVQWTDSLAKKHLLAWNRDPKFSWRLLEGGVLYVRYGTCDNACLKAFSELMDSPDTAKASGLILDLRGNPGGNTPVRTIAQLATKPIPWYLCRSRWSVSYYEAHMQALGESERARYLKSQAVSDRYSPGWFDVASGDAPIQPAEGAYRGPLVILTDTTTGSAAEDLVVHLHQIGRATIIGERTSGSTGQAFMLDLPGGGMARVCTVQVRYADGREFIGPGVQPDIPVMRTIQAIAEGRDEVLQAAIDYLRSVVQGPAPQPSSD